MKTINFIIEELYWNHATGNTGELQESPHSEAASKAFHKIIDGNPALKEAMFELDSLQGKDRGHSVKEFYKAGFNDGIKIAMQVIKAGG